MPDVQPFRIPVFLAVMAIVTILFFGPAADEAVAKKRKLKNCDLTSPGAACMICGESFDETQLKFAAYMKKAKKPQCFDDIGCMLKVRDGNCTSTQMIMDAKMTVRDFENGEEVKARDAFFVIGSAQKTPHGYGIIAFSQRSRADAFSAGIAGSRVMDYETMVETDLKNLKE